MISETYAAINAKLLAGIIKKSKMESKEVQLFLKKHLYPHYLSECGEAWMHQDHEVKALMESLEKPKHVYEFRFRKAEECSLQTLQDATYGTYITFGYSACSNVKTQYSIAPNGLTVAPPRRYEEVSVASNPHAIAVKVPFEDWEAVAKAIYTGPVPSMYQYNMQSEILYIDTGWVFELGRAK